MRAPKPVPPDWVIEKMRSLRHPFLNKQAIARAAGVNAANLGVCSRAPYQTSRTMYNKIAAVMKWPEWTDDE